MSYFLLARGDGTTAEQYSVSRDFTYLWGIYPAVTADFTYVWDILVGIQADFTYKWNLYIYVATRWYYYKWDIKSYLNREFTYIWNIYATAADIGSKVKYHFRANAVVNRFYRKYRG